jgi:hypothetical protein
MRSPAKFAAHRRHKGLGALRIDLYGKWATDFTDNFVQRSSVHFDHTALLFRELAGLIRETNPVIAKISLAYLKLHDTGTIK